MKFYHLIHYDEFVNYSLILEVVLINLIVLNSFIILNHFPFIIKTGHSFIKYPIDHPFLI